MTKKDDEAGFWEGVAAILIILAIILGIVFFIPTLSHTIRTVLSLWFFIMVLLVLVALVIV